MSSTIGTGRVVGGIGGVGDCPAGESNRERRLLMQDQDERLAWLIIVVVLVLVALFVVGSVG